MIHVYMRPQSGSECPCVVSCRLLQNYHQGEERGEFFIDSLFVCFCLYNYITQYPSMFVCLFVCLYNTVSLNVCLFVCVYITQYPSMFVCVSI